MFEEAFGWQALSGPPEPDQQQRTIDALSEHIARLKSQLEKLQAEISQPHHYNFQPGRRKTALEALITKESHNSSRPPSTDPPWAKRTRNLRRASGKRPGGQAGHRGVTLRLAARPSRVVEHHPQECQNCHSPLVAGHVMRHLRQQVWDVVPAKLKITEYRLAVLRCPLCGRTTQGEFSGSVRSGIQYRWRVKA